jgi:ATP-dependent DNA helicase RecG
MAPTEILAQQHYDKVVRFLDGSDATIDLVTSNTSGKGKEQKADIVIGTHALIQEKVKYKNLGLVIIDEQHRFGVLQRKSLVQKGKSPDILIMTATPIPRSLALTLYGDLDRSVIDEMPPGRTPVKTYYVTESKRSGAYNFMREKIKEGRQVFIICPLVEESEKVDLKAAMDEAERLQNDIFPDLKVGLIHGRLPGDEKDRIMKAFKDKKIDILVSTTVIEVGIDEPNATVMVVEHAERFGLSQLHQLRGRIGRGSEQSFCFLIGQPKSEESKIRIKAMLDLTDGFAIAEVDLKLRGPGDFFGTKQSGLPEFRVADIIRDEQILREARQAVIDLGKL